MPFFTVQLTITSKPKIMGQPIGITKALHCVLYKRISITVKERHYQHKDSV